MVNPRQGQPLRHVTSGAWSRSTNLTPTSAAARRRKPYVAIDVPTNGTDIRLFLRNLLPLLLQQAIAL